MQRLEESKKSYSMSRLLDYLTVLLSAWRGCVGRGGAGLEGRGSKVREAPPDRREQGLGAPVPGTAHVLVRVPCDRQLGSSSSGCSHVCVLLLLIVGPQNKALKEREVLHMAQLVSCWLKRPISSATCLALPSI